MRDIHDKQYEQFALEERFSLTISALARNDIKEADRLWDTCPKFNYRAHDLEYTHRVLAMNLITMVFFQKVVYHYNVLQRIENWFMLNDILDLPSDQYDHLDKTRCKHITRLKALYQGLKSFCAEVAIDADDFLKTVPDHVCFDINDYLKSEIEPTEKEIQDSKIMLIEHWQI